MNAVFLAALVGLAAGGVTTVAGFGGGLLMTLVLSLVWGPHEALATAAVALLVGNVHRLVVLHRFVDRSIAPPLAAGAFVGAVLGGAVAAALTPGTIRWVLLAVSLMAVARALGWLVLPPRRAVLVPGGVGIGFVAATSGGGALLMAPLMLAIGLTDTAFLATGTAVALAVHVGRIGAYVGTGMLGGEFLGTAVVLALGMVAGNAAGFAARRRLAPRTRGLATWAVLVVGLLLAGVGVAGPG